jgi:hypothetical protein
MKIFDVKSPAQTVARLKMNIKINITLKPFSEPFISEGLSVIELPIVKAR